MILFWVDPGQWPSTNSAAHRIKIKTDKQMKKKLCVQAKKKTHTLIHYFPVTGRCSATSSKAQHHHM